jgi:hypothetical protein
MRLQLDFNRLRMPLPHPHPHISVHEPNKALHLVQDRLKSVVEAEPPWRLCFCSRKPKTKPAGWSSAILSSLVVNVVVLLVGAGF